jgi:RTX calcium-binding nonapeptide repeat (4 copies)
MLLLVAIVSFWGGTAPARDRTAGGCTVSGTAKADRLWGSPGRDVICGRGGGDKILGAGGSDVLRGGSGPDRLLGGAAADLLVGGHGRDRLEGGAGGDRMWGGPGDDVCVGDAGHDIARSCRLVGRPRARSWPGLQPCPPSLCRSSNDLGRSGGPKVEAIWVTPGSADTEAGAVTMVVHVAAFDFEEEISRVTAEVSGPGGFHRELELSAVNQLHYEFTGSIALPQGSPAGIYSLFGIAVSEPDGSSLVLDQAAFEERRGDREELRYGWGRELVLYEGPDNVAPELQSLSISPPQIDTGGGPASVRLTMRATDGLSGLEGIGGTFQMPNGGGYGFTTPRLSGNALDGEWILRIDLPHYAAQGTWTLEQLSLTDRAGNAVNLTTADLEARGLQVSFEQTAPGDSTPPTIAGLEISPQVIHAGSSESTVNFDVHLIDDLSGINSDLNCGGWIEIESTADPSFGWVGTPGFRLSGDDLDGVTRIATGPGSPAPFGTYEVTGISTCDRAFNMTELTGSALKAKGWDLTFERLP